MTVFSLTNSNNQRNAATNATGWTSEGGGGAGPGVEPDFIYSGGISRKVGTTLGGFKFVDGTPVDMTAAADNTLIYKTIWVNSAALLTAAPTATVWVGSDTSNYNRYDIHTNASYPAKIGWQLIPINPNLPHWVDVIVGTASLTAIDTYVFRGDFSTAAKSENLVAGAIDISPGLYLTGGTGADPRATWQAFVEYDETGGSPQRIGHASALEGITQALNFYGTIAIGQTSAAVSTATGFLDEGQIIFFPGGLVDVGWNRILIDIATAGDDYSNTRSVITGLGRKTKKVFFTTRASSGEGNINATTDHLIFNAEATNHSAIGFVAGDAVLYSKEGGTAGTGLTDATVYFVGELTSDLDFALYDNRANAVAGGATGRQALTEVAGDEIHSITLAPDTRPDYTVTGTTDTHLETGTIFNDCRKFTLTSAAELNACVLNNPQEIALGGGTIDGCTINGGTYSRGTALIADTTISNLVNNTIVSPTATTWGKGGHAFEFTGTPAAFAWTNALSGFGPDLIEFHTTDDIDDVNDELDVTAHGYSTGDAVYYQDQGGVASIGLTDGQLYYVRAVTANSLSFHTNWERAIANTNKVALTATGAETHEIASARAAIFNNTGSGTLTINVSGGGSAPSIRNADGATTIVNAGVTITVTVKDADGAAVEGARVRVELVSDGSLVADGSTNASGVFTDSSFIYVSDTAVRTKVRLKGFKPFRSLGTIEATGLSVGVSLIDDPAVDLP